MILEDAQPVHVHNPRKIKKKFRILVSEPETKKYKVVAKKRRFTDNFVSMQCGYE